MMQYYYRGRSVPSKLAPIYRLCPIRQDESLELVFPHPKPVTADEMRADLE